MPWSRSGKWRIAAREHGSEEMRRASYLLGATLPWRGRVAERSEAGWGELVHGESADFAAPHPGSFVSLRCDELTDPPPPGEGDACGACTDKQFLITCERARQSVQHLRQVGFDRACLDVEHAIAALG